MKHNINLLNINKKLNQLFLLSTLVIIAQQHSMTLNGILDYSHFKGEPLPILVGPLTSIKTQIPYKFFNLGICEPEKEEKYEDNLGEILTGNEMYKSGYSIKMKNEETCSILCSEKITEKKINSILWFHNHKYTMKMYLDKLPAAFIKYDNNTKSIETIYQSGIPIGYFYSNDNNQNQFYIYNHFQFKISIHEIDRDKFEVVGFAIFPFSIKQSDVNSPQCQKNAKDNLLKPPQKLEEGDILFTYDVVFESSTLTLATRWDNYKYINTSIHITGVVLANVIILCLTLLIVNIFCKNVQSEIDVYNRNISNNEIIDELAWKNVSNDVFRPCKHPELYCVLLGNGLQLFLMLFFSLLFGVIGLLKPEYRNNILSLFILFYVLMGFPSGLISTFFYKILGGENWFEVSSLTALMFPGILFSIYFAINVILKFENSSAASNAKDIASILILWICCSTPLVLLGGFLGLKMKKIKLPCDVNPLPSTIPNKECYFKTKFTVWIAGLISFCTIFIELIYVMGNLWQQQIYFIATFIWISVCIMIVVSGEITCILTYVNLCKGDYAWWWKSYFIGGSSTIYFIIFTVYYFFFYLKITRFSAIVIYFSLMGLLTLTCGLINAGISSLITFMFVYNIYSLIKMD